jgi:hypothetical protein
LVIGNPAGRRFVKGLFHRIVERETVRPLGGNGLAVESGRERQQDDRLHKVAF